MKLEMSTTEMECELMDVFPGNGNRSCVAGRAGHRLAGRQVVLDGQRDEPHRGVVAERRAPARAVLGGLGPAARHLPLLQEGPALLDRLGRDAQDRVGRHERRPRIETRPHQGISSLLPLERLLEPTC